MLKIENLDAGYGKLQVLSGVKLEAAEAKITVIVGPNGSGKSTLLKSISGISDVYSGSIKLGDLELTHKAPNEIARSGVAYLPQTDSVFANLSVRENLRLAGYTLPQADYSGKVEKSLQLFPALTPYLAQKAVNLSGGERQMLAMAMAIMREPKLVLFDEPTANLSPKIATQVLGIITSLTKEMNLTTLLVEQNARRALDIGDMAYLLVGGKNAFTGTAKELLSHQELARMYLGIKLAGA
jgi:branched-chain amino acid transport system ATP-binding protein